MVDHVNTQVAYTPLDGGNETNRADDESEFNFFGDDGFSFLDFVDMINPLQHIPVLSTAYRQVTGDEIDPGARLAGGTLFGGPIGLAASAFNVLLEHNTGKDVGEHVVALFEGEQEDSPSNTQIAENATAPNPMLASFSPLPSEEAAFAAGDASLRMANLYEFMSPNASQIPTPAPKEPGSAGIWSPPLQETHPFPTERPFESAYSRQQSAQPETTMAHVQPVLDAKQDRGFKAKQPHLESINALQAFARDMQVQQKQPTQPVPATTTSALSQAQNNGWFADMMSQNMERYIPPMQPNPKG